MKIYENEYYLVETIDEYKNVPGLCQIKEKNIKWYDSSETVDNLAVLEHTIRRVLLDLGATLTGIYREEKDVFRIIIIPYFIDKLEENNISPDLYQPYINKYLDSFSDDYKKNFNNDFINRLKEELD